jgi:hypothetical protein
MIFALSFQRSLSPVWLPILRSKFKASAVGPCILVIHEPKVLDFSVRLVAHQVDKGLVGLARAGQVKLNCDPGASFPGFFTLSPFPGPLPSKERTFTTDKCGARRPLNFSISRAAIFLLYFTLRRLQVRDWAKPTG